MLSRAARVPLGGRESGGPESPRRLLLPLCQVLGSAFTRLVEEPPLPVLAERGGDWFVPVNGIATACAILHETRR